MKRRSKYQLSGFTIGIILFIILLFLSPPENMSTVAWSTAACALLMAIFWITEALPLYVTALLPVVLFPLLGVLNLKESAQPFAHPLIFLFLGGFLIAQAMQKWNLHKRIALYVMKVIGFKPRNIVAGFMISSAFLSMWISNTATALMMLPIAMSIIALFEENSFERNQKQRNNFSIVLMLAVAYACSIGGVGTLIGTPPNALMAAFMSDNYSIEIGFAQWMLIGVPFVLIALPAAFLVLTKIVYPVSNKSDNQPDFILNEINKLGKITNEEKKVAAVFLTAALLWMFRPLLSHVISGLTDTGIAIFGAIVLFVIPAKSTKSKFIMDWKDAEKISWGILILFGGGLSLASAIQGSGLAEWIGNQFIEQNALPILLIVILITVVIIFLTELTSNLATTAAFLPIAASIAVNLDINPLQFVIPAAIAASCAFMLPVATPPNAIVFSSGKISINSMVRSGLVLNIIFVIIIVALTSVLGDLIFY